MADDEIPTGLGALGDGEEFNDLPEFANEQNKELHSKLKSKEKALADAESELEETKERIATMEQHLQSVNTEHLHTQRLVDQKIKEIETEDHLKQLAERERGRFYAELQKLQKEGSELQDKISNVQGQVFKGNEKMDQFKLQMNWNQEELEQWALAARQKEEDNLALLKYTKADEAKMKDLNLHLEKLLAAVGAKQLELETEVTETQAAQIQLEKTAVDFRQLHEERTELVDQWEAAVKGMQKRDEAIRRAHEEFATAKRTIRDKTELLGEREAFLETEEKNNAEVDNKIGAYERSNAKKREQLTVATAALHELSDQVEVVRNTLNKAASEMANRKRHVNELSSQVDDRKARLDRAKKKLSRAEKELERSYTHMGDLEASAKHMEEINAEENAAVEKVEKELTLLKEKMFAEGQKLFEARQQESQLLAEISGAKRISRNTSDRIRQLDEEAQRQAELVYAADFQLQLMERKVARASGHRTPLEQKELKAKIAELTEQLAGHESQAAMLTTQLKRLTNDLKQAKRQQEERGREAARLSGAISELEMKNTSGQHHLKTLTKTREESMVSHDVLKLDLKRLRETLNTKADEVFGLRNRKFQLQMSMDERQQEIDVHTAVLKAQLKAAEEERHLVAKELAEKLLKVERLGNKYDIICGKMPPAPGGDGDEEEHSQAYYIIKAAQEREELQRQGDELDQRIQKAEREIRALEKTLVHLSEKNAGYKRSFTPLDQSTPQYEQKVLLEEQHRAALSKFRAHRLEQAELEDEISRMKETLGTLEARKAEADRDLMEIAEVAATTEDKLSTVREKVLEATSQIERLLEEQRSTHPELEFDIKAEQTRATVVALIEGFSQLGVDHPSLGQTLETAMAGAGIPPPTQEEMEWYAAEDGSGPGGGVLLA